MASKKQQKAGFPLPNPIDGWPLLDICLKIPNAPEYRRAFIGHINQLGLWAIWEKSYEPGDTRARDAAQIWRRVLNDYLDMGCTDMNCCCDDPPAIYRYDVDGNLERSTDGGTTWTPAPGFDPRQNATIFPPLPDNDKCQAATNVKHHFKDHADKLAADDSVWAGLSELVGAFVALLLFLDIIGTLGALTPLVMAIAGSLLWTGQAAFVAAMTTEVYDTFKCIVYCHVQEDGSFTDGDIDAIISAINSQITGIAQLYFSKTVTFMGRVGMTNMARTGSGEEGDCSACGDCSVHVYVVNPNTSVFELVLPDDGTDNEYTMVAQHETARGVYVWYQFFQDNNAATPPDWQTGRYESIAIVSGGASANGTYAANGTSTAGHWPAPDECPAGAYAESAIPFTVKIVVSPC